jgi:TRAP-type C4-dicarboxylate transport system substrate-binding protein
VKVSIFAAALLASAAAQAEPVPLKFAFPSPPSSYLNTMAATPWLESVNKDSDGTLDIKLFPSTSIANTSNVYDRLLNGVADIGRGVFFNLVSSFPRTNVTALPFEGDDCIETSIALWRLYAKGVLAGDDYDKVKPLALFVYPQSNINTNKPVATMADLKGMKLAALSRPIAQIVDALGGTPVTMVPPDMYPSMQRGLVQGLVIGWSGMHAFKLGEVTTHHLDMPSGQAASFMFMNKDAYAKLPAAARTAIDRNSGEKFSRMAGGATEAEEEEGKKTIGGAAGHVTAELTPAESKLWKDRLAPITAEWVKTTPDGEKVLAAFRAELAALRKK